TSWQPSGSGSSRTRATRAWRIVPDLQPCHPRVGQLLRAVLQVGTRPRLPVCASTAGAMGPAEGQAVPAPTPSDTLAATDSPSAAPVGCPLAAWGVAVNDGVIGAA